MSTPDGFNDLEELLKGLPVREPSRMLDERVASALRVQSNKPKAAAYGWAIAAAVLLVGGVVLTIVLGPGSTTPSDGIDLVTGTQLNFDPPDNPSSEGPAIVEASHPVDSVNLTWTRDIADDNRYTPEGEPYRAVVREVIDQRAWVNPETGEHGVLCLPHEEVVVIKQSPF